MGRSLRGVLVVFSLVSGIVLGTTPAFAQQQGGSNNAEGFGVQIIGGPLFSNFDDAAGFETEQRAGYLVGLGLGGNRGGRVGVEGDILYGKRNSRINGLDFDTNVIHVPVMLKVNVGSGSANGLSVFALGGGFFDWQFNGSLAGIDLSDDTNGFEAGVVAGAGIEFLRFSVQGRYLHGLRSIDRGFNIGDSVESKSRAFAVLFGLRLN